MDTSNPAAALKEQAFTIEDRARIRAALLSYAKEHRIGVPTLRERIAKATGRTRNAPSGKDPYLIDQKTLQRFLSDSHRTNDAFIVPLNLFVETNCSEPDAIGQFALGASRFFSVELAPIAQPILEGKFAVLTEVRPAKVEIHTGTKMRRLSTIDINPIPGGSRATERVMGPEDGSPAEFDGYQLVYEGVVFSRPEPIIVTLRNALTGFPKSYWFYSAEHNNQLYGCCSTQPFETKIKTGYLSWHPKTVLLDKD